MGQALYRKYRSHSFDEVIDQEHITSTLKKAIKSGRISHAYLFTGPRGVGKTSVARILAHEVNAIAYKDEGLHLDIIEIDAASNRCIDEIRDLRDKVHITPSSAKYKVYIIDEVHMLTREAFNALLKTLEEPPPHCIFILATTEAHKVPETITSRTQRFTFRPISNKAAHQQLTKIAKSEKIDIETEALELLAQHSRGSFRDSLSLLDQLSALGHKITEHDVRDHLGIPQMSAIDDLVQAIEVGDSKTALAVLQDFQRQSIDDLALAKNLAEYIRGSLLKGARASWHVKLLKDLVEVPGAFSPREALEISILEASIHNPGGAVSVIASQTAKIPAKPVQAKVEVVKPEQARPSKEDTGEDNLSALDSKDWQKVLEAIKTETTSLYSALRLATPYRGTDSLVLIFEFPLHQKKVNQLKNLEIIAKAAEKILNFKLSVRCEVNKHMANPKKTIVKDTLSVINSDPKKASMNIQTINNIFGSAELIES